MREEGGRATDGRCIEIPPLRASEGVVSPANHDRVPGSHLEGMPANMDAALHQRFTVVKDFTLLGVNSIELLKIFLKNLFEILVLENLIEKYFLVLKCQEDFQKDFQ